MSHPHKPAVEVLREKLQAILDRMDRSPLAYMPGKDTRETIREAIAQLTREAPKGVSEDQFDAAVDAYRDVFDGDNHCAAMRHALESTALAAGSQTNTAQLAWLAQKWREQAAWDGNCRERQEAYSNCAARLTAALASPAPAEGRDWTPDVREAFSQPIASTPPAEVSPAEKFCDGHCVWTDHHSNCVLATPSGAQQVGAKAPAGFVMVPRDEAERLMKVLRYAAHPQPSPHGDYLATLIAESKLNDAAAPATGGG
jgi:hypothetical protein